MPLTNERLETGEWRLFPKAKIECGSRAIVGNQIRSDDNLDRVGVVSPCPGNETTGLLKFETGSR
jgi:hypothetical protein